MMDQRIKPNMIKAIKEFYSTQPYEVYVHDVNVVKNLCDAYIAIEKVHNDGNNAWLDAISGIKNADPRVLDAWDNNGWIDPAIIMWNIVGYYNLDSDSGIVTIDPGYTCKFITDYMNVLFKQYKTEHHEFRFEADGDNTDEFDTYSTALFMVAEYVIAMISIAKEK